MKQLLSLSLFAFALCVMACQKPVVDTSETAVSTTPDITQAPVTFADAKYTEVGKAHWSCLCGERV